MSVYPFPSHQRASSEELLVLIPALRAFARTFCRNKDDADDLVQETLTKAISNLGQFQPGTRMRSWLFTIMRNTYYTRYWKAVREAPGQQDCVAGQVITEASQEWSQRSREVARALDALPAAQRQVIMLVCMVGVSYLEAAEICGCDIGTVKSRVSRARSALVQMLGDDQKTTDDRTGGRRHGL